MDRLAIEAKTKAIVAAHFKTPADRLEPATRLREDLGGDSLDLLELAFEVEQQLGVEIPDASLADVRTVGDAIRYAEALTS